MDWLADPAPHGCAQLDKTSHPNRLFVFYPVLAHAENKPDTPELMNSETRLPLNQICYFLLMTAFCKGSGQLWNTGNCKFGKVFKVSGHLRLTPWPSNTSRCKRLHWHHVQMRPSDLSTTCFFCWDKHLSRGRWKKKSEFRGKKKINLGISTS